MGDSAGNSWTVRPCSAEPGRLSEGPRWDGDRNELLWVDVLAGRLHRARPGADGQLQVLQTFQVPSHLGAAAPAADGGYVLAAGSGFLHIDDAGAVRELAQPEAGRTDVRMNDGACDPQGRFWSGTMAYDEAPGAGCLYRLELDGRCTQVLTGLTISNGIGWSPDGTTMYLADSGTADISAFDFDPPTGDLSGRRTAVHITAANAVPDGLTVDHHGNIWVALWNGGALARYHPDGSLLGTVPVPVDLPTSCAFGGTGGGTLFITTARGARRNGAGPAARRRALAAARLPRRHRAGLHALPWAGRHEAAPVRKPIHATRLTARAIVAGVSPGAHPEPYEEYAELLGEQLEGRRLPTWSDSRGALAATWPMVSASYSAALARAGAIVH